MATQVAPRKKTRPSLFWLNGTQPGQITILGDSVVIGRDEAACDVVLDSDLASRRHARVMTDTEGHAYLTDLGSSNGTFVNGEPVTRVRLVEGDRVGFGTRDEAHCVFRGAPAPREEAAAPTPEVDASEAPTAALSGEPMRCPLCRCLITPGQSTCIYCTEMPTQSKLDETVVPNAETCVECGAAARGWGAFCHRCGGALPGR